jgi:Ligand-gated ion channel
VCPSPSDSSLGRSPRAIIPKLSTLDRIFYWTCPFSSGVWYLLAASTITFASFMFLFERRSEGFAEGSHSNGEVAGHALFKSFTALAVFVPFEPETAGGRIAAGVHSFSLLLIVASYTANLAASYTTTDSPIQLIHSVSDFGPLLPACVRASSTLATFLNTTYPSAASAVTDQTTFGLNSYGSAEALRGVLSGKCVGAVIPFYEAQFVMNANDTEGEFCNLIPVGPTVGEEVVSFTFAPEGAHPQSLTAAQLEAFNLQLASLHQTGDFLIQTEATYFPPPPRPVCAPQDAADAAALAVLAPAAAIQVCTAALTRIARTTITI